MLRHAAPTPTSRVHALTKPGAPCDLVQAGTGNTGLAVAKVGGKITWMSLPSTCVLTGAAPVFCPSTNLVGPYGITWPENVETSNAAMSLARSALAARALASATSRMHE